MSSLSASARGNLLRSDSSATRGKNSSADAAEQQQRDKYQRAEALRLRGLEAARAVDFATAERCHSAALAMVPSHALALANRSAVYCALGEGDLAIADARQLLALEPDDR